MSFLDSFEDPELDILDNALLIDVFFPLKSRFRSRIFQYFPIVFYDFPMILWSFHAPKRACPTKTSIFRDLPLPPLGMNRRSFSSSETPRRGRRRSSEIANLRPPPPRQSTGPGGQPMGRLATQWLQDGHLWKVRMVDDDDDDDDGDDDDDDHHHHHHDKTSTHEHRHNHQNHLGFPPQSQIWSLRPRGWWFFPAFPVYHHHT